MQTFWHSSSHILGQALELEFGVDLTIGPSIEEGFYYDCYLEDGRTLTDADKAAIEKRMQQASSIEHCACCILFKAYITNARGMQIKEAQRHTSIVQCAGNVWEHSCCQTCLFHVEPTSSPAFSNMSCLHALSC